MVLVGGLDHVFIFHSVGNVIIPIGEFHHFSEGLVQPPTRMCFLFFIIYQILAFIEDCLLVRVESQVAQAWVRPY